MKTKTIATILLFATLSACAMNAKGIEDSCYTNPNFKIVADCISKEVDTSPSTRNKQFYELYATQAQLFSTAVKKGQLTSEEAKLRLSAYRVQLELENRQLLSEAFSTMGGQQTRGAAVQPGNAVYGNVVYSADECIGPVIMGKCEGAIIDKGGYHPTCHGEWLNNQCTGPMF